MIKVDGVDEIEVQRAKDGADIRRARLNSSLLDTEFTLQGQKFHDITDSYVIFITEKDVLGKGLPPQSRTRRASPLNWGPRSSR